MNKIYKVIWSKVKHQYVVVSDMEQSKTPVRRRVRTGSSGRQTEQRSEQEYAQSDCGACSLRNHCIL